MKQTIFKICLAALTVAVATPAFAQDFQGAKPNPIGRIKESVNQLRIVFPEEMKKAADTTPMTVTCAPKTEGYAGWADNDTMWTYNFDAFPVSGSSKLAGGSKCKVEQKLDMVGASGKVWKAGTLNYEVVVGGPNVQSVIPAAAFKGSLRDSEPVLMIVFDGAIDQGRFFANQNSYLNYLSASAPSEKMFLSPVPIEEAKKIFEIYKMGGEYLGVNFEDKRWVLATVKQNLIPGSQVNLTVEKTVSLENPDVQSDVKFQKDFLVRSNFRAEVVCANMTASSGKCLPNTPITVNMNGMVKWGDIRDAYIEYIPFKSTDRKTVRSFAEIDKDRQIGLWDSIINYLSYYFPYLARFSDTVLDQVVFNVNIEPETQAKVVLPAGLKDIENRTLANTVSEFFIQIGAMTEEVRMPHELSFFENKVEDVYMPVGVVNMNQTLTIRKSGATAEAWEPVSDVPGMIQLIRAYAARGEYRKDPTYVSPLEQLKLPNNKVEEKMTGIKNRPTVLQFPFKNAKVGLYAIEVSSPAFEARLSDKERFYNPKYTLAQVTDLAIHLKKGTASTVAWVTQLSNAQPAAGASVQIFNCLGHPVVEATTDASGLVTIPNQKWATDCQQPEDVYSQYFTPEEFYVVAKSGNDQALIHSSWVSSSSYAFSAPGVEWFDSSLQEGQTYFHAVIGVNLVKPGQRVPIELYAKVPQSKGFREVPEDKLPKVVRIVSQEDSDLFYEFPVTWNSGKATLQWSVPADSSVQLGAYDIMVGPKDEAEYVRNSSIEVAEFKVPLMTGLISFPTADLVKPDSIPVNAVIRYANGVGAKALAAEISYYFSPSEFQNDKLPDFRFGTGQVQAEEKEETNAVLPESQRPAVLPNLVTKEDGSLVQDIAAEKVTDGRSIAEVLKSTERPQRLIVRVRYQDQMGEFQTISQAKSIYNQDIYVGTNLISGERATARLQAAAVNVAGKNLTTLSDLEFKLVRIETRVIGEELFGGLIKNTLERELKPVRWTPSCAIEKSVASCSVGTLKEGSYAFQVTSKSSKQSAHSLFKVDTTGKVYGPNQYFNFGDDEDNKYLPLALNKESYKDGDQAVVSFSAPFKNCNALVTTERDNILDAKVVANACQAGNVSVAVNGELAPNVFVSVYAVTGRADSAKPVVGEPDLGRPTYRLGFANMKVNWSKYTSNVKVATEKQKYEPGQDVNVTVQVAPEEGALTGGSVTLVAIEEKILELRPNETYEILNALMQMRGHGVQTVTALERIETVTGHDNQDAPEAGSPRKGGDEGGDGGGGSEMRRKLFNALVAYQANIPVENGIAKWTFKTNDSLTKFKVIAIAADSSQKFGMGATTYLSEKDTQAYSNIPSVAHNGDSFPVKVTVQNNTSAAGTYKVEVTVVMKDKNGKVIGEKKLSKSQMIDKSGSASIDAGQIDIPDDAASVEYVARVYDENGKLVDVLEPEPQVVLASVPLSTQDTRILQVENGALTRVLEKDPLALADKGEIRVIASKSLVGSALSQIGGKVSQDKFADFFIESRFNRALLMSSEVKNDELKAVLEALVGFMDSEGFIKYYPQAHQGSLFLTANIINSLQLQPWTLKLVPAALSQRLQGAVSKTLSKSIPASYVNGGSAMDWLHAQTVMGRAAYAFGDAQLQDQARVLNQSIDAELANNPNAYGQPVDKWSGNLLLDRWLLEIYVDAKAAAGSAFYKQLIAPARLNYAGNQAMMNGAPYMGWFYSDETMETSKLLLGVSMIRGDANLARALAVGMVNVSSNKWYNAVTLARVSEGLRQFGMGYESEGVTGSALLSVPEENKSVTVEFSQKATGGLVTEWKAPKATVNVTYAGPGKPWVSLQTLTAIPITQPRGQGMSIEKTIKNITRDGGNQAGDIIEVSLLIKSATFVSHVAMIDPIPAGSNIVGEAYGSYSSGQKAYAGYKLYFAAVSEGATEVKYQYQLNNPGTFKLPPTRAEGLFMPSVFAEAPNTTMKVK